ncbi:MAG: hypothetical protein HC852_23810 [Acaryochloridaceae cyanobacterium RU_4_10]|nr:hypothetical protein [Acaryochloridaceae cyanobacterium RU_4_10]
MTPYEKVHSESVSRVDLQQSQQQTIDVPPLQGTGPVQSELPLEPPLHVDVPTKPKRSIEPPLHVDVSTKPKRPLEDPIYVDVSTKPKATAEGSSLPSEGPIPADYGLGKPISDETIVATGDASLILTHGRLEAKRLEHNECLKSQKNPEIVAIGDPNRFVARAAKLKAEIQTKLPEFTRKLQNAEEKGKFRPAQQTQTAPGLDNDIKLSQPLPSKTPQKPFPKDDPQVSIPSKAATRCCSFFILSLFSLIATASIFGEQVRALKLGQRPTIAPLFAGSAYFSLCSLIVLLVLSDDKTQQLNPTQGIGRIDQVSMSPNNPQTYFKAFHWFTHSEYLIPGLAIGGIYGWRFVRSLKGPLPIKGSSYWAKPEHIKKSKKSLS